MKKIYLFLTALMLCVAAGAQTTIKGDVNGDGTVDIADVTEVVNIILNPDSDDDTPTITTGEAIDLGLSVKWASCNVGATAPEEYGGYYAWGETEEKSNYGGNYKYWSDKNGDGNWDSNEYVNIGSDISGTQYDVAHVKWGGSWRMPTLEEQQELLDNCNWYWAKLNGIYGYRVTGPNGNSIFLPAAGYRNGTKLNGWGSNGLYWSSSLNSSDSSDASILYFFSGNYGWGNDYRNYGLTVRPVCP